MKPTKKPTKPMKPTKVKTVYLIREAATRDGVRPQVTLERTAQGRYTYGVRVTDRSLERALARATQAFQALREHCLKLDRLDRHRREEEASLGRPV